MNKWFRSYVYKTHLFSSSWNFILGSTFNFLLAIFPRNCFEKYPRVESSEAAWWCLHEVLSILPAFSNRNCPIRIPLFHLNSGVASIAFHLYSLPCPRLLQSHFCPFGGISSLCWLPRSSSAGLRSPFSWLGGMSRCLYRLICWQWGSWSWSC